MSINIFRFKDVEGYHIVPTDHKFRVAHNLVHLAQVLQQVGSLSHRDEHACLVEGWRPNPLPQILLRS